jgi:hypothetical protein
MRFTTAAVAAAIDRKHLAPGRDDCIDHPGYAPVPVQAAREPMDQHDWRAGTFDDVVDCDAVDIQ